MTAVAHSLEDFAAAERGCDPVTAKRHAGLREAGREEGYAEGFAEGERAAQAQDREAIAELRESLADAALVQVAIREEALAALKPLVEGLVATVAPTLAAEFLPAAIAEIAGARAAAGVGRRMRVVASANYASKLRETLADVAEVVTDESEGAPAARIDWGDGGASIDVDAALEEIKRAMVKVFGEPEGNQSNVG